MFLDLVLGNNQRNDIADIGNKIADNLITNHVESDAVNKGKILEACDFFLTPYRKLFYGKTVSIASNLKGVPAVKNYVERIDHGPKSWEKVLWITLAVIAAPLAAVAAFFKLITYPTIGTKEKPFTIGNNHFLLTGENFKIAVQAIKDLKATKLQGRVQVYFKLTPELQKQDPNDISERLIQEIEQNCQGIFSCVNVNKDAGIVSLQCNPLWAIQA